MLAQPYTHCVADHFQSHYNRVAVDVVVAGFYAERMGYQAAKAAMFLYQSRSVVLIAILETGDVIAPSDFG